MQGSSRASAAHGQRALDALLAGGPGRAVEPAALADDLRRFVAGETLAQRVRACYPFVRVQTATVARADSRLSYGFVAGPGTYETTLTRPDLFSNYYQEQFRLLLKNHGVPIEVGTSTQPIPKTKKSKNL